MTELEEESLAYAEPDTAVKESGVAFFIWKFKKLHLFAPVTITIGESAVAMVNSERYTYT